MWRRASERSTGVGIVQWAILGGVVAVMWSVFFAQPPAATEESSIGYRNGVVSVAASYRVPIALVSTVNREKPVEVRCGFLDWVEAPQTFLFLNRRELPQANDPLIHCWEIADRPDGAGRALPGYPRRYQPGSSETSEVVTAWEVTRVAADSVTLPLPQIELSPPLAQLVGVPTWLAVTNELTSAAASAQSGPVWAIVQPRVRSVIWEMGNGDSVTCTRDMGRVWRPREHRFAQSACAYTFGNDGESGVLPGNATVVWDLLYQNNETGREWRLWRTVGRTVSVRFLVSELQAATG